MKRTLIITSGAVIGSADTAGSRMVSRVAIRCRSRMTSGCPRGVSCHSRAASKYPMRIAARRFRCPATVNRNSSLGWVVSRCQAITGNQFISPRLGTVPSRGFLYLQDYFFIV